MKQPTQTICPSAGDSLRVGYEYRPNAPGLFRTKYSTELALNELVDQIHSQLDGKKPLLIAIFMDLSKAFDTIDHEILITKMEHYGIKI